MNLFEKIRILTNTGKSDSEFNLIDRKTLFLLILTIFSLLPISSNAQSWLDFNYRRALTITNSGGSTLTDYQVLITLTNSNFNNNFPQPDGDDIRITASDGTTLLPYWIESWSSNQGTIWTKIPSIPVGTTTIYLYYGNNVAVSVSNGANTFELFEDDWIINPVHTSMQPSWEHSVTYPNVFKEDSMYYMIWDGHHVGGTAKGLSTSTDLINWTPYANNPIMGFDSSGADHGGNGIFAWGDVIKVGSTYHMFPAKGPTFTYHAKSTDLIQWTGMNNSNNFDSLISNISVGITTGVTILKEGDGITPVVTDSGRYWMVYGFKDFYLAWSQDLIHWFNAYPNAQPFLVTSDTTAWDRYMWTPSFVRVNGNYYIYYQGSNTGVVPWRIGYVSAPATGAPNEVTWTKAGDPLIGPNHGWEIGSAAIDPVFRFFDSTYYLFYTGGQNNGFATSSSPEGPWHQNSNWYKGFSGGLPNVSNGIIHLDAVDASLIRGQSIESRTVYPVGHAVGYRAYFHSNIAGYKWGGFTTGGYNNYVIFQVDVANLNNLLFITNDSSPTKIQILLPPTSLSAFHNYDLTWSSALGQGFIDHEFKVNTTFQIFNGLMPVHFANLNDTTTTLDIDWVYTRKFSYPDPSITTVGTEQLRPLYANLKVFLEGPYSGNDTMTITLNTNNLIPLNSNTAYSTSTYGYTASVVGSIPNATIVDWVLVELRTGTASGTKVGTRAAFLKRDGTIVDIDGTSQVQFLGLSPGNYYVVIRHRNHLAIMSASTISLNSSSATLYDFSTSQSQAYTSGTDPMVSLTGGGFGMIAADANNSAIVTAADVTPIITDLNLSIYSGADINMSAIVTAADVTPIITNLNKASNVPN